MVSQKKNKVVKLKKSNVNNQYGRDNSQLARNLSVRKRIRLLN